MKGINRIIDMLLSSGRSGDISLDSDGLLESLAKSEYRPRYWWEIPYQKGLRLILVIGAALMMITAILYYGIRYINDVILFDNQLIINNQGAFNPKKSMNCEYALYLFNTAELWANSGIQVNAKDKIRINFSGAYNSWVEGTIWAADNNRELEYPWVSSSDIIETDTTLGGNYCISRGCPDFGFGSAMYAIVSESGSLQSDPLQLSLKHNKLLDSLRACDVEHKTDSLWRSDIVLWKQIDNRDFHPAEKTGNLYFAVNDMYFQNSKEIESYYSDQNTKKPDGSLYKQTEIESLKCKPMHCYNDNLGQLLVSIEIQRHVPHQFFRPSMVYRYFDYKVNYVLDSDDYRPIKLAWCLWYLLLFSCWIALLFSMYLVALLFCIYLLFFIGNKLSRVVVILKKVVIDQKQQ